MTNHGRNARRNNAGVALLTALGALVIFTMLGSAYAYWLVQERQRVELFDLQPARARAAAEAGVQAQIAAIAQALAEGQEPALGIGTVPVTLYRASDDASVEPDDSRSVKVEVSVADESARINLNYAPTLVLAAILGVNPNQAREIRMHLPRIDSDDAATITSDNARWLASVDELHTRGFIVDPAVFEKIDRNLLTVHSGAPGSTGGWLNVNTASPEVLAAVLGISLEEAQRVQQGRPFTNADQFLDAVGRDPMTFNARPAAGVPGALPRELAFGSRCYRIVSHAVLHEDRVDKAGSTVEAVVYVHPDGRPEIRYWNETPGMHSDPIPAQAS